LFGEAVHLAQAQSGAFSDLLGGEERIEHARQGLGRNAPPGVGHRDLGECAGQVLGPVRERHRAHPDRQPAAARHGVAGVHRDVEDRELEFGGIDLHRARRARHLDDELDIAAQRRIEQIPELRDALR